MRYFTRSGEGDFAHAGCLPHVSEGKGESHPAATSPESRRVNPSAAANHLLNGSVHGHAAAGTVPDVLSGEDSAPDERGRAVTSPAGAGAYSSHACCIA